MKAYVGERAQNPVDGRLNFRSFMLQLRAARGQEEEEGGGEGEVPLGKCDG